MPQLDREEYVEQAYFFRTLGERLPENMPIQELLALIRDEVLSTTKLPMAIDFMLTELNHTGAVSGAMKRLPHYFSSFQTYLMEESEDELGRFDMRVAISALRFEAEYRTESPTPQGVFLYEFETLSRNRLSYDRGLRAMSEDSMFDDAWRGWILAVRRKLGMVDFSDMLYVCSEFYRDRELRIGKEDPGLSAPILFGEKEGKIALANRHKDPLFLFSALQRQLGYPVVPRPSPKDSTGEVLPKMRRQLERLEVRMKLLEDEQREGAFDLSRFYQHNARQRPGSPDAPNG